MTAKDGKPCGRCGTSEWYKGGHCKKCQFEHSRKWRENNPDKAADKGRRWRQANLDKHAEHNRRWRQDNGSHRTSSGNAVAGNTAERSRLWRQENPDKVRQWKQANLEKNAANNQRRRAKKAGNGGSYTAAEFKKLCDHYGNKCLKCGRKNVKLTADHIKPVIRGGSSYIENIQPLCLSCNSSKGDKHIDYRPDAGPLRWLQAKLFG